LSPGSDAPDVFTAETVWELRGAGEVRFGEGAAGEVPAVLAARGVDSALVVTDPGVREAGVLDEVSGGRDDVDDGGVGWTVFDGVEPDPPLSVFESAVEAAREADPDAVVGVGGGSSMDVAKVTAAVAPGGGGVLDYAAEPTGGGEPLPGPGLPVVAVPTTAGTGSETTPVAVVSLPDRDLKVGVSSRHLYPDAAVVDPLLAVSLPPRPTAASGMDALAHAVEAYTTRRYDAKAAADPPGERPDYGGRTRLTDAFALEAMDLVGGNLRGAVHGGTDVPARRGMALGSHLAGRAFSNAGLGAAHAVAMAAGAAFHTPHGETVAAVLPAVMRFNAPVAGDRYRAVAGALGVPTEGLTDREAADRAAAAVAALRADVGLPDGLSALGVGEDDVAALADRTTALERLLAGNPRRVDRAAAERICRDAL
jgi:alcohol dehydrogenase class IV